MDRCSLEQLRRVVGFDTICRACIYALCLFLLGACAGGVYHEVQPGQNLFRISRTYGVSEITLAQANRITDPTKVRIGTKLFVPGADRVRYVPPAPSVNPQPVSSSSKTSPVKMPKVTESGKKPTVKTVPSPNATVVKPVKKAPVTVVKPKTNNLKTTKSTEVKKLQWPLRGKIVRSFSSKSKAGGGKGIEIAVRAGSSIQAAEAGKVIYSGDGVKGYGHLIILQHENELFTVYGFNQRNFARQGDFVSKGERIGLSGVPPSGGAARLHFEVRKGKQAVNPILYLP